MEMTSGKTESGCQIVSYNKVQITNYITTIHVCMVLYKVTMLLELVSSGVQNHTQYCKFLKSQLAFPLHYLAVNDGGKMMHSSSVRFNINSQGIFQLIILVLRISTG